eukprot:m.3932 g.3932  ORF g.3932 m.3932 type:complete len:713 (+) comp2148_c0_seq1:198-2336(+)
MMMMFAAEIEKKVNSPRPSDFVPNSKDKALEEQENKMTTPKSKYPPQIRDHYDIRDTLGSGGFAKVKVARHKATQTKVAIKIMSKAHLQKTHDLHRAKLEIDALKEIKHQNIARMYEVVETDEMYFMVLEYASGGELFDYIILREKLKEGEARKFFREICSAVNYCHSKGIIHRDLKPENLLLDDKKNIKLIDFGLLGRPKELDVSLLKTCCGSAAYAAPELIRGEKYIGPPADVWSLGILLYALLCGFLPFDDENTQVLYKQIQRGMYEIPPWLSFESQKFIGSMLRHKPEQRITMPKLLRHPWMLKGLPEDVKEIDPSSTLDPMGTIYQDVVKEMGRFYNAPSKFIQRCVEEWKYDEMTAMHELLASKQKQGEMYKLTPAGGRLSIERKKELEIFLKEQKKLSPLANTVATSRRGSVVVEQTFKDSTPLRKNSSPLLVSTSPPPLSKMDNDHHHLVDNTASILMQENIAHLRRGSLDSSRNSSLENETRPRSKTVTQSEVHNLSELFSENQESNEFGSLQNLNSPRKGRERRNSNPSISPVKKMEISFPEGKGEDSPLKGRKPEDAITPSSSSTTPSSRDHQAHPRRGSLFGSFARSLMNVFGSNKNISDPRVLQGAFTAKSTSSRPANDVFADLIDVLREMGCEIKEPRKFQVRAYFFDQNRNPVATIHFEVCLVARMQGTIGIHTKRIKGDTWEYKQKVREVLGQLKL